MSTLADLWPGLDLRHLAAFAAVADARSFARAAERLGYTQPAVSQQVAALEKIVGQRLFERSSGRPDAGLTEAGSVFSQHVEALTEQLVAARRELDDLARGESGVLRIGAFQTALSRILPVVLRTLRSQRPGLSVEPVESTDDATLVEQLLRGSLDLAFVLLPLDERLDHRVLVQDEFVLVSRAGDRRAGVRGLDDLDGLPLITHRTCRSTRALLRHLEANDVRPRVVLRSDDNAAIKEMVRSGLGVALLPELWLELGGNDGLRLESLAGLVPPRVVTLAWRRDAVLTQAQLAFVEAAAAAFPQRLRSVV